MATQWTAGLTDNTVLPAATLNRIGAAWETWTPTFTPSSGAFTTVTTTFARYGRIQNTVYVSMDVTLTNVGTGTGVLFFTLPVTARTGTSGLSCGTWREIAVYGYSGIAAVDSTTSGSLRRYDNASYVAANERFTISMQYEAA
jgi:hypothetical protein